MDRRQVRSGGYWAAVIAGALAILFAGEFLAYGPIGHAAGLGFRVTMMTGATALVAAWALWFAVMIYRNMDEFGQQASRVAWYWGCGFGLALAMPIYVFVITGGLALIEGANAARLTPAEAAGRAWAFRLGVMIPMLSQLGGFLVVRTWWSLAKR